MAAVIRLYLENPPDLASTFTTISVERAPDNAGVAGVWAQIGTVAIDPTKEYTTYVDLTAADFSVWYRYHYVDASARIGPNMPSDAGTQGGIFYLRDHILTTLKQDDPDLTNEIIKKWANLALEDLYGLGIWTPQESQVTIAASLSASVGKRTYQVGPLIKDVFEVWTWNATEGQPSELYDGGWTQLGDTIRLDAGNLPKIGDKLYVVGKGRYRDAGEVTHEAMSVLVHLIMTYYYRWKLAQMANFKPFESTPRDNIIRPGDLRQMIDDEQRQAEARAARLQMEEPAKQSGRAS